MKRKKEKSQLKGKDYQNFKKAKITISYWQKTHFKY